MDFVWPKKLTSIRQKLYSENVEKKTVTCLFDVC